ncbi:hypothetical protein F2P56_007622 [Juglans regia]|uniref:Uncharacterized protein LOC108982585 n=2 Tax=Juglans regia TaxID=51240 RepID=A0A2I4DQW7_JUGRE|nr:uncharacterized protein LOC108982585 [Juglans regia]KAF5475860.1 hypothetical protein F2P56_007622 [Juglans regia]
MASRKIFHAKPNYIYPTSEIITSDNPTTLLASDVEFEETDIWNSNHVNTVPLMETKRAMPISRQPKKTIRKNDNMGDKITPAASTSLPVNIPDWSKILKGDFKEHRKKDSDEDHHVDVDDEHHEAVNMIPPHEYLARTRGASFSVHEGRGRTLKGRDLRRVRNAIWKKIGFED